MSMAAPSPLDHQGLVRWIARHHADRGIELDDLIQQGQLGLLRACEKYEPGRRIKFATYASFWVRAAMLNAIQDHARPVRVPRYLVEAVHGKPRSAKTNRANLTAARKALKAQAVPAGNGLLDPRSVEEPAPFDAEDVGRLRAGLAELPEPTRTVLVLRFGLDGEGCRTLAETGQAIGRTRERARQIEVEGLARLREILRATPHDGRAG